MRCIVSHVSPSAFHKSSLMFVVQCFVSVAFVPLHPFTSISSSLLTPSILNQVHKHVQHTHTHTCASMHTHTNTQQACLPAGPLISSSLVVFAPSFSAFNSAPLVLLFRALSIAHHDLTRQNLASSLFLPECKSWNVINLFDSYQVTLLWRPKAKH